MTVSGGLVLKHSIIQYKNQKCGSEARGLRKNIKTKLSVKPP